MRFFIPILLFSFPFFLSAQTSSVKDIDAKVEALLARMSLDEKIGQLIQKPGDISTGTDVRKDDLLAQIKSGKIGSLLSHTNFDNKIKMQRAAVSESRLGIPLIFGFDVIHGYKTIFPIPLAQAATWDLKLIEEMERIAATEAAADGQHWTFTPMVDVSRDPRWGRVMEGAGEDPWLGAQVAAARIRGIQGRDLADPSTLAACTKHYAGYGFAEGGRDYNSVDISDQRLRETVLPPFEAAAKAGSATFMNAFNTLAGTPASMHKHLITDVLRGEWAWKGLVVSDWNSFGETIVHGAADNEEDAAAKCLNAGSDMDMAGTTFENGLKKALENGRVTQAQIDNAVRRVLRLKYALGLFDDPFRYLDPKRREATLEKPEFRKKSREVAAKSMVLLKNDGNILPLRRSGNIRKIALVGPFADSRGNKDYMSFWTLGLGMREYDSTKVVTPAMALKPRLESMGFEVELVTVCAGGPCGEPEYSLAQKAAFNADLTIVCVGERGFNCGESRSVSDINLPYDQERLVRVMAGARRPVVMVVFNSRPMTFQWSSENLAAILLAWQPGFEAGNALADVLTGDVNPAGKLPMSFPRSVGQIPVYYNHLNTGRPQEYKGQMWSSGYLDNFNDALYPFGYGLSYTKFSYGPPQISQSRYKRGETVQVSVVVTNSGEYAGDEVVQCYIRDLKADIARPLRELKGFEKIRLEPGQSRTVTFNLTEKDLSYWNQDLKFKADPGFFQVFVGTNSRDAKGVEFEWGR